MKTRNTLSRGEFIRMNGAGLIGACAVPGFFMHWGSWLPRTTIGSIRLYKINVDKERNFSHGTWTNRQHVIVQVSGGGMHGWSEALAAKNDPALDLAAWSAFMKPVRGIRVDDALEYARSAFFSGDWKRDESELVQLALYDLGGKISGVPVIDTWNLKNDRPVPGVYTILENEVEMALREAGIARQQGLVSHVKLKMFGNEDLDGRLVTALRTFFGPRTFLMADANRGYRHITSLDELARILSGFREKGLDAMEDPSGLDVAGWIALQKKVAPLALIPDYIMRPAPQGLKIFDPAMGMYFNLHPDQMGVLTETAQLARKIKDSGKGLMIGDSSFIGPSCTIWQQIAVGAGASWVEAIEKPQESDIFLQCITRSATRRSQNGMVSITEKRPGFGLEVDAVKLKNLSQGFYELE